MPEGIQVLGGKFAVAEAGGNRFAELPGAPLDTHAFLFGPTVKSNATAGVRVFATPKGRRMPAFAVSLGGLAGFRLQVAPMRKAIELLRGDEIKTSIPFEWKGAQWIQLEITQRRVEKGSWAVEGRVWYDRDARPDKAQISWRDSKAPSSGPAGAWGLPFSGTPIRFDDINVTIDDAAVKSP